MAQIGDVPLLTELPYHFFYQRLQFILKMEKAENYKLSKKCYATSGMNTAKENEPVAISYGLDANYPEVLHFGQPLFLPQPDQLYNLYQLLHSRTLLAQPMNGRHLWHIKPLALVQWIGPVIVSAAAHESFVRMATKR